MSDHQGGLARSTDPDTSHEAAAAPKSRARAIAQSVLKWAYPSSLTARELADYAEALFPAEVRDEEGFLSKETIRRRWHELDDPRLSPDGEQWGEIVYEMRPDGSPVTDLVGSAIPARFRNPLGNGARAMVWIPR